MKGDSFSRIEEIGVLMHFKATDGSRQGGNFLRWGDLRGPPNLKGEEAGQIRTKERRREILVAVVLV